MQSSRNSSIPTILVLPTLLEGNPVEQFIQSKHLRPDQVAILIPEEDSKSQSITIEQLRETTQATSATHSMGQLRYLVVHPADKLTTQAQHAFLKFLEEPAPNLQIVLLTSRPMALLPTIRSRCMMERDQTMNIQHDKTSKKQIHPLPASPADLLSLTASFSSREDAISWCEEMMVRLHLRLYDHPTDQMFYFFTALREALRLLQHNIPYRMAIESPFLRHVFHLPDNTIDLFGQPMQPFNESIDRLREQLFSIDDTNEMIH